jgi:hypothetical protein
MEASATHFHGRHTEHFQLVYTNEYVFPLCKKEKYFLKTLAGGSNQIPKKEFPDPGVVCFFGSGEIL